MKITEKEAMDQYDDALNEQGIIKIGNLEYEPAYVLKEVDPTAYQCGFADFVDSLFDDGIAVEGYTENEEEEEEESD